MKITLFVLLFFEKTSIYGAYPRFTVG